MDSKHVISATIWMFIPPPFNPWWKDLPLEWIHSIALETSKAEFENNPKMNTKSLRFRSRFQMGFFDDEGFITRA